MMRSDQPGIEKQRSKQLLPENRKWRRVPHACCNRLALQDMYTRLVRESRTKTVGVAAGESVRLARFWGTRRERHEEDSWGGLRVRRRGHLCGLEFGRGSEL